MKKETLNNLCDIVRSAMTNGDIEQLKWLESFFEKKRRNEEDIMELLNEL